MYFGADYYPEHWPEERWHIDAGLMKEAGFNLIRVAEFAWAKLEPSEGVFDFEWLDRALDVFFREEIQVMMGTPTATPPKWLMDKYPGIYQEDESGEVLGFGSRRHYCYNSGIYREYTRKITEKVVTHYRDHPAVVAWQIDNEFTCGDGLYCYCEDCRQAFIEWCRKKYRTLDTLNKAWGTVFWSQTYTDWNQIIVPKKTQAAMFGNNGHNPGLNLDYSRFQSDSIISYCGIQSDIIRMHSQKPVTHNVVSELFDYYKMADKLDICTYDNYPASPWGSFLGSSEYDPAFAIDMERGIKNQNIWVIEQQCGPCGWDILGRTPRPGQLRNWTYQALAHGAESIVYFRWRACLFGTEEYWYGILDHDGIPRRRYDEIKAIGQNREALSRYFSGSTVVSDILMIRSFEQQWSHSFQSHSWNFKYRDYLRSLYAALFTQNLNIDISHEKTDFSQYKLVLAPAFNLMDNETLACYAEYVRKGGNLVVSFRSGTKNKDNSMFEGTLPGYFRELAGIEVSEFDSLSGTEVKVSFPFGKGKASIWADIIETKGAEILGSYSSEYYSGKAAVSVNRYGKGKCYYLGCDLDDMTTQQLLSYIVAESDVQPAMDLIPDPVEVVKKRTAQNEEFYVLMNHSETNQEITFSKAYTECISNKKCDNHLILGPYESILISL